MSDLLDLGEEPAPAPEPTPAPPPEDDDVSKHASITEKLSEMLGMTHITADPEYKDHLDKLEEFEKGIKNFKVALQLYMDKLKAATDAGATLRVLATSSFGEAAAGKLEAWSEARSKAEAATTEAIAIAEKVTASVTKYEDDLKASKDATNKLTIKARRAFEHYDAKVTKLTQQVLSGENDLARRATRDKKAREDAEAKHLPPPEKTHYFFEDSNDVAEAKLDKLKDKLKKNEDKLETATVWNERTHAYGKLAFKSTLQGCEADVKDLVKELVELDTHLAATSAQALPTYQACHTSLDSDTGPFPPLADRLAACKVEAGFEKTDVPPQATLDDDDEEETLNVLCGYSA